jgi:predicted nucleic acid-binding protein
VLNGRPYAIEIVAVDGDAAQAAGELLGRTRLKDATVDALIVATAIRAGASTILTTDITDVRRLAEGRARVVHL